MNYFFENTFFPKYERKPIEDHLEYKEKLNGES